MEREQLIQLVQAAQSKQSGALGQLYEAFFNDTYFFIQKTVNDSDLAADLTQDTFMEVFEKIDQLQAPEAFISWIRQIAYHRCTAYFRKRKDILLDEKEENGSIFDTIEEDRTEFIPDAALDQEDLKRTILQIINSLPAEQRAAIMMRYYDELSVADIAAAQDVSEGTVKSRLNYGRKVIKSAVEDYEKKNGIKLHSVAIIPLLLWLFRFNKLASGNSLTQAGACHTAVPTVKAQASPAAPTSPKAPAGSAVANAAKQSAGGAAKGFLASTAAKVIAGVTAAALVLGGLGIAISFRDSDKGNDSNERSPSQQETVNGLEVDEDGLVTVYLITRVNPRYGIMHPAEHQEIIYDENGFPSECQMYRYNGEEHIATSTYTIENDKIKTVEYREWVDDERSATLTFNENNQLMQFADERYTETFTYDEQGRLIEFLSVDNEGEKVYQQNYYTFDGNTMIVDYYHYGEWDSRSLCYHDEDGKLTRSESYDVRQGKLEENPSVYEYDEGELYYPEVEDTIIEKDHAAIRDDVDRDKDGHPYSNSYFEYTEYRIPAEKVDAVLAIQEEILHDNNYYDNVYFLRVESRPNHPALIIY